MKIIAESGSTRTEWCMVEGVFVIEHAFTEGLNPYFQNRREISRCIRLQLPEIFFKKKAEKVFFYGAGCSNPEKKDILAASLVAQFKTPIEVESDLLGAGRCLFGHEAGIACILGTGSNSCFYDGEKIVKNVKSLGYVLGDEGSGAVLGKMFLSDCLKNLAPADLIEFFYDRCKVTADDIMKSVYNCPTPNRFLSSFAYFLADYTDNEYVHDLIYRNFRDFFTRNLMQYDCKNYPVRFVGSIAHKYAKILNEVALEFGVTIDRIEETHILGLVEYHTENCRL